MSWLNVGHYRRKRQMHLTVEQPNVVSSQGSQKASVSRLESTYLPFLSEGLVSLTEARETFPIRILRDTGATQSLMVQDVLPYLDHCPTGASELVQGIELSIARVPLHRVFLKSKLVSGFVTVGVRPLLPLEGIDFILGNDLAGSRVNLQPELQVVDEPEQDETARLFPSCVVTKSAARRARYRQEVGKPSGSNHRMDYLGDGDTTLPPGNGNCRRSSVDALEGTGSSSLSRAQLVADQKNDYELCQLAENAASMDEASGMATCYYNDSGILMRKWRPPTAPK